MFKQYYVVKEFIFYNHRLGFIFFFLFLSHSDEMTRIERWRCMPDAPSSTHLPSRSLRWLLRYKIHLSSIIIITSITGKRESNSWDESRSTPATWPILNFFKWLLIHFDRQLNYWLICMFVAIQYSGLFDIGGCLSVITWSCIQVCPFLCF